MTSASPGELAAKIVHRLQRAGFTAFWVGGCVRDFLLGREPQDFDIATDARPEQIEKLFKRTVAVGRKFGVIVVVEDGHHFQVATFRSEENYADGRRPAKVIFADARADALRRDFTVNGLFYDPTTGKIKDWVGGESDLRSGILRAIGPPEERFAEDHLRLLRAVRLAAQLGFEIEPRTFSAIRSLASKIKLISAERIRDELIKLFAPPTGGAGGPPSAAHPANGDTARGVARPAAPAARGLMLLRESGLMEHVLPELGATISCDQSPDYHPEGTVFEHIRRMLERMPPGASPSLPWAAILHDIGKPAAASRDEATGQIHFYEHEKIGAVMAEGILRRLRFPRRQIDEIVACVRQHMQFKDVKQMRTATLRRLLLRETFPLELELHRLDCLGSHGSLAHYDFLVAAAAALKKQPTIRPPLLAGADLIALGMTPGPAMGSLLREIREKQLQDELKTPRQARSWAKKRLHEASSAAATGRRQNKD
ncbi:MAG: CCA tRNA nucleotidyltransferase [Verrucomicrobiota bacterium]|nr:CCA tRNA nucleotidyltransferase [Verrucomicrobiota bacterium]